MLKVMDENARAHGGTVFTFPGMFSFNLWSGRPTPTPANVTHWFSLLSATQQQAIVAELQDDPRACVVVNRFHLDYVQQAGFKTEGPLVDFIGREFEKFNVDDDEFWVRRGGRSPLLHRPAVAGRDPGPPPAPISPCNPFRPRSSGWNSNSSIPPHAVLQSIPFDQSQQWEIAPSSLPTASPTVPPAN